MHELASLGQAVWLDYIRRTLITSGRLQQMIRDGLLGMTSNPTIFDKAIAGSPDYDDAIKQLAEDGKSIQEIYETLTIEDIRSAADAFAEVFQRTNGNDGYVSLEVNPKLAHDSRKTIEEAKRLFQEVNRPNVMIKVPATHEGLIAVETLIGEGIPVNVTLIFSLAHYKAVAEAYLRGLENLSATGGNLAAMASVASFFISRIDAKVDSLLEGKADDLKGKAAIANAKAAYRMAQSIFFGDRWNALAAKGARPQRLLWASTGTKNPDYPDTLYIDELIGADTVNTVPPATLEAFLDHGKVSESIGKEFVEAEAVLQRLADMNIDLNQVGQDLQDAGVLSFEQSFESLMHSIQEKKKLMTTQHDRNLFFLNGYEKPVEEAANRLRTEDIIRRIWAHDHTVWKDKPDEIANRLDWLHSPEWMLDQLEQVNAFVDSVVQDGMDTAVLLGMGGSSLAPEVFRETFGVKKGYLDLHVLDSTDPGSVIAIQKQLDPAKTLFIVSTKSGGTVETFSFFKTFFNWMQEQLGSDAAHHFIAITDKGSGLESIARQLSFREIFLNNPNIGGRFSALSFFGLLPAALLGVDLSLLLDRAQNAMCNSEPCLDPHDNVSAKLGIAMGELAKLGRDKLTFIMSDGIQHFGDWVEQLIAESTGKEGKGILPVSGEPLASPETYGKDRLFVALTLRGDKTNQAGLKALADAGHPVIELILKDAYDLGSQCFVWEMAAAIAGHILSINTFDQPNVESAKVQARAMVDAFRKDGKLPAVESVSPSKEVFETFLGNTKSGGYISLQAFIEPTDEAAEQLAALSGVIRSKTKLAVTRGFGPRFLHSTGQLHKGDAGNGCFIQFISNAAEDLAIPNQAGKPESDLSFQVLIHAQAAGDYQALVAEKRRVLRVHLGNQPEKALAKIVNDLS